MSDNAEKTKDEVFNALTGKFVCAMCGRTSRSEQPNRGTRKFPLCFSCGRKPMRSWAYRRKTDAYGKFIGYGRELVRDNPAQAQLSKVFRYIEHAVESGEATIDRFTMAGWDGWSYDKSIPSPRSFKVIIQIAGTDL